MKTSEFRVWFADLFRLSRGQREEVEQALGLPVSPPRSLEWLEQAHEGDVCCPKCRTPKPYRWGRQAGMQRYRCRQCGHIFNLLSGTPLSRLRHKDRWLCYCDALIEGLTVRAAADRCGIDQTTAFRWRHRFLQMPAQTKAQRLEGIAEADETYFPYSCKGQRHLERPPRQRGRAIHTRGTGVEQVPVLIVRDRSGATADFQLKSASCAEIEPPLRAVLARDAVLCSDGAKVYQSAAEHLKITHRPVNLTAGIRVIAGVYHVQNVNAYDSRLKGWMAHFHGVATKYLENYLGWRRWLERWGQHNAAKIGIYAALGWENQLQLLTQT